MTRISYAEYLTSEWFAVSPLVLYPFDAAPSSYSDPVTDASGNGYDGTWYDDGSIGDSVSAHAAILGNGSGSIETLNTWVTCDHDLPEHASFTLSCLCRDVDPLGNGWDDGVIAGRPYAPTSYPRWEMALDAGPYSPNPGTLHAGYITAFTKRQYASGGTAPAAGSAHVVGIRYDADTRTLTTWLDGVQQATKVLASAVAASTPAQRLQVATSTLYKATSHWAYWDSALTDEQIAAAAEVALDAGYDVPDITYLDIGPLGLSLDMSVAATLTTRIQMDGGTP